MGDKSIYFVSQCFSNGNWSQNVFLHVYPNHSPQNLETDLGNNGLREKVSFMDLRNSLLIPTSSHLVLAKGGKTIGAVFIDTKPPLWVFQNLGCPEFSFLLSVTFGAARHVVQELERDVHTGLMVGEADGRESLFCIRDHLGPSCFLSPPNWANVGTSHRGEASYSQLWRRMGIGRAGSPTREPRAQIEPRTCTNPSWPSFPAHKLAGVTRNGEGVYMSMWYFWPEFGVGQFLLWAKDTRVPQGAYSLVGEEDS